MTVVPTENIPTPMLFYVLPISILGLVLYNKFFRRIDSSLNEYYQLTSYLEYDKINNLKDYFDKNEVSISERINFLKSSHGLAFLSIYRKSNKKIKYTDGGTRKTIDFWSQCRQRNKVRWI